MPSKKATARIRKEIKDVTSRKNLALSRGVVITKLNETVRGWANCFYYGNCTKAFARMKNYP